jgi:hypothetical protein
MRGSEARMHTPLTLSNASMVSRLRAKSFLSVVRGMTRSSVEEFSFYYRSGQRIACPVLEIASYFFAARPAPPEAVGNRRACEEHAAACGKTPGAAHDMDGNNRSNGANDRSGQANGIPLFDGSLPEASTPDELHQDITTTAAVANCRRGPECCP